MVNTFVQTSLCCALVFLQSAHAFQPNRPALARSYAGSATPRFKLGCGRTQLLSYMDRNSNVMTKKISESGGNLGRLDDVADRSLANELQSGSFSSTHGIDTKTLVAGGVLAAGLLGVISGTMSSYGVSLDQVVDGATAFFANPQEYLQGVVQSVRDLGPAGPLYFGLIYLVAEILAIPATPLTLSAGYLFGLTTGVSVVLVSATIAASVAFVIGKTFLRQWVEGVLEENPKFAKLDRAIGKEGFKLLLLVRLSPVFPFALSNYLYGASSIDFASYFWGTLLGFTPGTIAYVYTGMVSAHCEP